MYIILPKTYNLALLLAISGTLTVAIPLRKRDQPDGCANIHESFAASISGNTTLNITYADVKNCYMSFPYDLQRATEVIESLKGIYETFYVFYDQAREQPVKGFDYRPIDLSAELDAILKKSYTTEFEFFSDVSQLYIDLRDDSSNNRCEVITIDGTPALKAITNFAEKYVKNSRDLGVRFNMALSSLSFQSGQFGINPNFLSSSLFTRRITLPESDSITYELKCNNSKTKTLVRPWIIINNSYNTFNFTDSKSYYESLCLVQNTQQPTIPVPQKNSGLNINSGSGFVNANMSGQLISNLDNFTIFYKYGDTGVVLVPNFLPPTFALDQNKFNSELVDAFNTFAATGVKKVVLDFTSNTGGFIPLAQFFDEIFLRQKNFTFPRDIKINNVTTFLIEEADKERLGSVALSFSPNLEQSIVTGQPFQNANELIGNNKFTRGGKTVQFSNLFFDILNDSAINGWNSPWTNKDIILLTNGACVSSCAQTAQYIAEQANIATVSVGGFYNRSMSYSSFPGGNVVNVNDLYNQIGNITSNTTDSPPPIPKNFANDVAMFFFTLTYSETHDLEFPDQINEFMFRSATHRLYYDDESILDPSSLWLQAAELIS
ncbi:17408_t:CDS:2 [Dentiscutata erythropus]|uniref:17408_t:CDS:1 n=1 Tax=Dentiscutata erythropus TaxID=1348616 RepID=A0A9N8YTK6_9GLOM|nr:17408_t:CDS:2 [Dentiscutata erythropus]